jgi:hypothetical protein
LLVTRLCGGVLKTEHGSPRDIDATERHLRRHMLGYAPNRPIMTVSDSRKTLFSCLSDDASNAKMERMLFIRRQRFCMFHTFGV